MTTAETQHAEALHSHAIQAARFALARAQQAVYYAHKHLIEHPDQLDAQTSYRAVNQRCDVAVAALREAEEVNQPS